MDRAYRYGQTRDVEVFRLLGAGSLEELIYARQVYKQQQMAVGYDASVQTRYFEGVQGDKTKQGELFGMKNIFKLHEDTLATKQAVRFGLIPSAVCTYDIDSWHRSNARIWWTLTGRWRTSMPDPSRLTRKETQGGSMKLKQRAKRNMYVPLRLNASNH